MKRKFVSLLNCILFSLLIAGSVISAHAQEREMGGIGITVFEDRNFRGKSATYNNDVENLDGSGFNDKISSIRVGPGERWEVCQDAYYQGRCVVISGEESDLRRNSWDNMISSFRRIGSWQPGNPGSSYIVLFDQVNYRGNARNYSQAVANLPLTAQSVTIGRGTWEFCTMANFGGTCIRIAQSVPDLRTYSLSRRIASARPLDGTVTPVPPPSDGYIVLYDQPNYRGNPTNYNSAASNLNRRAQSVTIGAGSWQFCEGANFTGRCVTLDRSTPNLSSVGMNRRVGSVRPAGFVQPGPQPGSDWYIVLYTQANYRGTPTNYRNAQPRITKTTGSVTIGKGVWEICSGNNFTGNCQTLSSSVPNMTIFGIFGRTIRSVRPVVPQPR